MQGARPGPRTLQYICAIMLQNLYWGGLGAGFCKIYSTLARASILEPIAMRRRDVILLVGGAVAALKKILILVRLGCLENMRGPAKRLSYPAPDQHVGPEIP